MKNIVCIIAYDGSKFCGFEKQKNESNIMSVAGFFEKVLKNIGIDSKIIGSGRTDKGVHATNQVINFKAKVFMPLDKMKRLLNDRLFPFVLIKQIFFQDSNFHARFSAKMRFYKYIFTKVEILPFYTSYISKLEYGDINLLKIALNEFVGTHDFALFSKKNDSKSSIRTIFKANIFPVKIYNAPCIVAHIGANAFLRSQIRIMMQACIKFSLNKISLQNLRTQIDNKININDKICIRELSPASGLYLTKVVY